MKETEMFDYFSSRLKQVEQRVKCLESHYAPNDSFERWWSNNGIAVHPLQDISAANLEIKQCARAAWLASIK
jgi:hypothetical protein